MVINKTIMIFLEQNCLNRTNDREGSEMELIYSMNEKDKDCLENKYLLTISDFKSQIIY